VTFTRFGDPVANATVEVFQQQDGIVPDVVKYVGSTDAQGHFVFPEQTTLEYASSYGLSQPLLTENPFSTAYSAKPNVLGTNGVLLFRVVEPSGVRSYTWLDVPQFNQEYARGHQLEGHYAIEVSGVP
jgi:hypothetical protein